MKFLANENFPLASVKYLRSAGYDITAIGVDHPGVADETVIQIATDEMRTILTFDRDYGELIFKHNLRPPSGVVYLRLKVYGPDVPGRLIHDLIQRADVSLDRALTVLDLNMLRQRKY